MSLPTGWPQPSQHPNPSPHPPKRQTTPKKSCPYWPPDEAQQWLPEILRLAETQGPQRIRTGESVITLTASPLRVRTAADPEGLTLGQYLVKYAPRGYPPLEIPGKGNPCTCELCQPELYTDAVDGE